MPKSNTVAAGTSDGSLFVWPDDGRGDALSPGFSLNQSPVGLAIRGDGRVFATAIREHEAMVWSFQQKTHQP